MYCPVCESELRPIPNDENDIGPTVRYTCPNCFTEWKRCLTRNYCPRCRRMKSTGYKLLTLSGSIISKEICKECHNDLGG